MVKNPRQKIKFCYNTSFHADVVELVDTVDLKSTFHRKYRFESDHRYQKI